MGKEIERYVYQADVVTTKSCDMCFRKGSISEHVEEPSGSGKWVNRPKQCGICGGSGEVRA